MYPSTVIFGLNIPLATYATLNGDIYCDNGYVAKQVNKYTVDSNITTNAMNIVSLNYNQTAPKTIAGITDTFGSGLNVLNQPYGIFIDIEFKLYLADSVNHRIIKFLPGQSTGIVVAGTSATGSITLNEPRGVILDGNGYVYIADYGNHRILGSEPNGFQCIISRSRVGSASNQLNYPQIIGFDTYGSIFVTDKGNNRIQKFTLKSNFCCKSTIELSYQFFYRTR
uniref:NHL repeat containing protein-like protein n=1 Tax=Adineta vaga TaxID=104782 RepID=B3G4Q6_ADIVA|nr:NHL repeat containing protein-like protein [Adineta vaga]